MNLILHIMAKDFRRLRWALALWAGAGVLAVVGMNVSGPPQSTFESLGLVAMFQFFGLSIALIAAIVQEDGLTESTAFWRTRPISGGRLLTAKLSLIGVLFVVIPVATGLLVRLANRGAMFARPEDLWQPLLALVAFVLVGTALASCCKDLGRYFLLGALCWLLVGFGTLGFQWVKATLGFTMRVSPMRVSQTRMEWIAVYAGLIAIAVLLNQYRGRRFGVSVGLMVAGVVGAAAINAFWAWPIR